jgi:hypothetical protein
MELPQEKISPLAIDPGLLIIAGFQKSGKTTAVAALDDNLIIDLEGGAKYFNAMRVDVNNLKSFSELIRALQASTKRIGNSEYRYKYGTIDTGSKLEDIALELAVINYRKTPMGKRWDGGVKDILSLPNGAGYGFLRTAYLELIEWLRPYFKTLILVCHIKNSSIQKDGEELAIVDISLTGQLKTIIAAQADAIGILWRKKNQSILTFRGGESFMVEARPKHLAGKEFVLIESDKDNNLTINWNNIFIEEGI